MNTKLRTLRLARSLTLTDVQTATGIDVGNLSRIERGRQEPKVTQAVALIGLFGPELELGDLVTTRPADQQKAA